MKLRLVCATAGVLMFAYTSATAAPELAVLSEQRPSFAKAQWVQPIEENILKRYRHEKIGYITFHHEGYADGSRKNFEAFRPGREKQTIQQRVINIHNYHVGKRLGMIA
jgi:hypothetical protein